MPVNALDWNPSTKTLSVIHARNCTINKNGNKINIDQTPTFDRSTKPWGITEGNEFLAGQLTGNLSDQEKLQAVIDWVNQFCFQFIQLLADFPTDDPYRLSDPNTTHAWWSDSDGTRNSAGLFVTEQHIKLVTFDPVELLANDVLIATITEIR